MNVTSILYKFNESYTEVNYNKFFNPNICHVCKRPSQGELMPCEWCNIVFYCCKQHQTMHQSSHMDICVFMTTARTEDWESNARRYNSDEDWRSSRKTFMQAIKRKVTRDLKPYEIEIFMCAKSCLICHQQINLRTCNKCYSANYCNEHIVDFQEKHSSTCQNLLVLLNLNISIINNTIGKSYPEHMKLVHIRHTHFDDMFTFVNRYIKEHKCSRNLLWESWYENSYIYSDYISSPLTLFYGLKEFADLLETGTRIYLKPKNTRLSAYHIFIVHIIGASLTDITGLPSWEIFLHLCDIKELRIVLIAPETNCEWNKYYYLCYHCRKRRKQLYVHANVSYKDYVSTDFYKQADCIIAFQAEFSVGSALIDIFIATQGRKCPFFFTTESQNKAEASIKKIREVVGVTKEQHSIENKFRSYRPYRDYETGGIYYRNAHLVMFL